MAEPQALLAGRYRLLRQVGRGGMGVVWEARDERLERPVAVKQLRPQVGLSPEEAELAKNRAMREARITARLHHRNAVPVFDVVEHEGQPCLIMQFVPSVPLSAVLRENGPLGVHEASGIGAQVASALAAAHQLGITHRDVKPGNVLLADDGTAMISDFGISHALGDATLTSTGLVNGTPAYLAPEVARGSASSAASDVFSLGATLYAATEGGAPFGSDANSMALLHRVASGEFPAPERAGALTPVVMDMLRADPGSRPSMREAAARLAAAHDGDAVPSPTVTLPSPPVREPQEPTTVVQPRQDGPPTFAAAAAAPSAPPVVPWASGAPAGAAGAVPPARRRRGAWVAAVALVVGLVVLGTALVAGQLGRGGNGAAGGATSSAVAPTEPSPSTTSASSEPSGSSSVSSPSASPRPTPSRTSETPSPSPTTTSGEPTASELADAITGYYALVPDDLDAAWPRMTADYQRTTTGGRRSYEQFWGDVDRVSVSQVRATPPSRVQATITYRRGDAVSVERTELRLVREDGTLKIAGSTVLGG